MIDFRKIIVDKSLHNPKFVVAFYVILTFVLSLFILGIKDQIDTDPENMLSKKEAVRLFNDEMKEELSLYDMVVVGVVNDENPNGVFNCQTLSNIYSLTEFAKTLTWPQENNPSNYEGVVTVDMMAPSTVDNVQQGSQLGEIRFEWLMSRPPKNEAEAIAVRDKALHLPFMNGTIVSEDGKALCVYLPLTRKSLSYKVSEALKKEIAQLKGSEKYYITGLPVAEDTFGVEMFIQMGICAPLAMLVIFLLMLYFFRKIILIISPMIVAMCAVLSTMGLLIALGYTVHIMSSMIPIFIMPIAVLNSIHILSEFFDRYQETRQRRKTMHDVMEELFTPMLYTSLTTAAGFGSLALAPIPPVQVFGIFVAVGVMFSWIMTVTFIPAYVMIIPKHTLDNFGAKSKEEVNNSAMTKFLQGIGHLTVKHAKIIVAATIILSLVAAYGISKIVINDNPTKWFSKSHPIRVSDKVLNSHFGGTYMAYLAITPVETNYSHAFLLSKFKKFADKKSNEMADDYPYAKYVFDTLVSKADSLNNVSSEINFISNICSFVNSVPPPANATNNDDFTETIDEISYVLDAKLQSTKEIFKQPAVLQYVQKLENFILSGGKVGKANSIVDIVKTVYRELMGGDDKYYVIPDTAPKVAEALFQFQNGHRPNDIWHFVTPDFRKSSMWCQMKSGDNRAMSEVADKTAVFLKNNPPPIPLELKWFGLTYINVVWQNKMVGGMFQAFLGSFLIVFLMMVILFRSASWGALCMIPLTVTIALIYGSVGLIGRDYDMPIAVLSSLTLGLAVDFAIHFLARGRKIVHETGSWEKSVARVFSEPARAITRNVIVIAVGFLPLLAAPLIPYKTVGVFLATILGVSGVGTLLILPALITIIEKHLFRNDRKKLLCRFPTLIIIIVSLIGLSAVNIHQFFQVDWNLLIKISVGAFIVLAICAFIVSHRLKCKLENNN